MIYSQAAASQHVKELGDIVSELPPHVPLASDSDSIWLTFQRISIPKDDDDPEERWRVLNRRMDALFGEDLRNTEGRLPNIMRGPFGLDMVVDYLEEVILLGSLPWEALQPKMGRLLLELKHFVYVSTFCQCIDLTLTPPIGPAPYVQIRSRQVSKSRSHQSGKNMLTPTAPLAMKHTRLQNVVE